METYEQVKEHMKPTQLKSGSCVKVLEFRGIHLFGTNPDHFNTDYDQFLEAEDLENLENIVLCMFTYKGRVLPICLCF